MSRAFLLALAGLLAGFVFGADCGTRAERRNRGHVEDWETTDLTEGPSLRDAMRNLVAPDEETEREMSKFMTSLADLVRCRDVVTDGDSLAAEAGDYLARWNRGEKP
jgi:hypothetical protein